MKIKDLIDGALALSVKVVRGECVFWQAHDAMQSRWSAESDICVWFPGTRSPAEFRVSGLKKR